MTPRSRTVQRLVVVALAFAIAACASRRPAPVETRSPAPAPVAKPAPAPVPPGPVAAPAARPEFYTVRAGDSAFGIATANGIDVRQLAAMNNLAEPIRLQPGQVLRVRPAQAPADQAGVPDGVQVGQVTAPGAIEARPLDPIAPPKPLPDAPRADAGRPGTEPPRAGAANRAVITEPRAFKLPFSDENLAQIQRAEGGLIARADEKPAAVEPAKPAPSAPAAPTTAPPVAAVPGAPPKPEAPRAEVAKPEPPKPEAAKPEAPKAAERVRPDADERDRVEWIWPANGRVVERFEGNNKGVDIGAQVGEPVLAAAPGRVVYSGSGLRGYGQLVIIKHNETYLSAYAHNSRILVKEGQAVTRGQKIAEVGQTDADRPKLHFEIRRAGKPVDPLAYLPER